MKIKLLSLIAIISLAPSLQAGNKAVIVLHQGRSGTTDCIAISTKIEIIDHDGEKGSVYWMFRLLEEIHKLKVTSYIVPDASYISISVRYKGKTLKSSSCHTLFERNGKMAAKSSGISPLNGKSLDEVLSGETKDFLHFRNLWEELLAKSSERAVFQELLPRTPSKMDDLNIKF